MSKSNRKLGRRSRRAGSAIVELTLSLTFIVPTMLYAGYLTDALYDAIKAQEATAAAAWSFSGELLHDYDSFSHTAKYSAAAVTVRTEINKLYTGLEPWNVAGLHQTPTELVGVSAKGKLLPASALCAPASSSVAGKVRDPSNLQQLPVVGSAIPAVLGNDLHTGGLISCQSQVEVTNWLWGSATGTSTQILDTKVWPSLTTIELCGVGAASGGSCPTTQSFVMYTDDWGLAQEGNSSGYDSWTNYPDNGQSNPHFYKLAQVVFENGPIPYGQAVQAAEAALPATFCSSFLSNPSPVDSVNTLDTLYDGTPHDTFILDEVQWQSTGANAGQGDGSGEESMDTNSPQNSYEGNIKQKSYTWPTRVFKTGPIKDNAYVQTLVARSSQYLGL